LSKAKYKLITVLLLCTITGLVIVTPATSAAPSWVGDGKYAKYLGGFNIDLGAPFKATAIAQFNWTMSGTTATQVRIDGGWNMSISIVVNSTPLVSASFGTLGFEIIALATSQIITYGGYDLFGLEQGPATVLWVENPGALPPANVSVGGRTCVVAYGSILSLPLPPPMNITGVPVTEYYDAATGVLMALNIVLNLTALMGGGGGFGGLGSFGLFTFPIVVTSTNVVPFAWNMGGDMTLWLMAVGVLAGISALFGVIVYARKR
jgi:hypothetical protein